MIHSQRLAFSGFAETFAKNIDPQAVFSGWRLFAAKLLLLGILIISVSLAWPRQAAFESSLSTENFLYLINQDRAQLGLAPLRLNPKLARAAYSKAQHMLRHGYFNHVSPEGMAPWNFIEAEGFLYSVAGENLALNYTSAYELLNDFLKSASHRQNLLSPTYSETGIAVTDGELEGQKIILTVQLFATPADRPSAP